ncbi:hypothetical protein MD484_g8434, partial [Candolleomyces efflorescens]
MQYTTCTHGCHIVFSEEELRRYREPKSMLGIGIILEASKAPGKHKTTDAEFIKFARRIFEGKRGTGNDVMVQYNRSWKAVYGQAPAPRAPDGGPWDFSNDDRYPSTLPWMGHANILALTGAGTGPGVPAPPGGATNADPPNAPPGPTQHPPPPSQHPSPPPPHPSPPPPLPSPPPRDPSSPPSPPPRAPTPPPLSPGLETVRYLRTHGHAIEHKGHPHLVGLLPPLLPPDQLIRVVWVLCPTWATTEASNGARIIEESVPVHIADIIRRAVRRDPEDDPNRYIRAIPDPGPGFEARRWGGACATQPKKWYRYNSWLQILLRMLTSEDQVWQVEVWPWRIFWEATLDPEGRDYKHLEESDLVMGGVHWTGDFLGVNRPPRATTCTLGVHLQAVQDLALNVTIWPDPREHFMAGAKGPLYASVNAAAKALSSDTVNTAVVTEEGSLMKLVKDIVNGNCDWVLKREYSAGAVHVFIPWSGGSEEQRKVWQAQTTERWEEAMDLERAWAEAEVTEPPMFKRPRWLVQPFVRELITQGELRAYCVGGHLAYVIQTQNNPSNLSQMQFQATTFFGSLHQARTEGLREGGLWDQSQMNLSHETGEFQEYVLRTLDKLILHEERQYGVTSGLRLFARLDVGVFKSKGGGPLKYCINEITRSHATGMFEMSVANPVDMPSSKSTGKRAPSTRLQVTAGAPPTCDEVRKMKKIRSHVLRDGNDQCVIKPGVTSVFVRSPQVGADSPGEHWFKLRVDSIHRDAEGLVYLIGTWWLTPEEVGQEYKLPERDRADLESMGNTELILSDQQGAMSVRPVEWNVVIEPLHDRRKELDHEIPADEYITRTRIKGTGVEGHKLEWIEPRIMSLMSDAVQARARLSANLPDTTMWTLTQQTRRP